MSRLPVPDPGWTESTEGESDPDLTDEAGSRLEDWQAPVGSGRSTRVVRVVAAMLLVAILGGAVAQVVLSR